MGAHKKGVFSVLLIMLVDLVGDHIKNKCDAVLNVTPGLRPALKVNLQVEPASSGVKQTLMVSRQNLVVSILFSSLADLLCRCIDFVATASLHRQGLLKPGSASQQLHICICKEGKLQQ